MLIGNCGDSCGVFSIIWKEIADFCGQLFAIGAYMMRQATADTWADHLLLGQGSRLRK